MPFDGLLLFEDRFVTDLRGITPTGRPGRSRSAGRLPAAAYRASAWLTKATPAVFVVLWSLGFIAGAVGVGAATPLLLTFSRFAMGGLLLTVIALLSEAPWPRGRQFLHVVMVGLLMQAVQYGAFYTAMGAGLPSGVVALVQGFSPVITALLARGVLGESINPKRWIGFAVGAAGVGLAVFGDRQFSVAVVLLAFVGLLGLSLGTLYQKRFAEDVDVRSSTAVQFLASAAAMGMLSLLLETPRVNDWGMFGASLTWIGLNSVGAFLLLNVMLRKQAASRVSTLFFTTPAVTALLAWAVLGQTLSRSVIIGLALGGIGVVLTSRK